MSKICSKCSKPVYPLEELKCLDKEQPHPRLQTSAGTAAVMPFPVNGNQLHMLTCRRRRPIWHKTCFKCWDCGTSLTMKNFKGFDKKPYCLVHYPQMKATMVTDTPELQRIAHNTKIQSQVKYHEDFEKNIKGSRIEVTDDPETVRALQANRLVSHQDQKGKALAVTAGGVDSDGGGGDGGEKGVDNESGVRRVTLTGSGEKLQRNESLNSSKGVYKRIGGGAAVAAGAVGGGLVRAASSASSSSAAGHELLKQRHSVKRVGSISDYDPVNERYGSLTQGYHPTSSRIETPDFECKQSSALSEVTSSKPGSMVEPSQSIVNTPESDANNVKHNHTITRCDVSSSECNSTRDHNESAAQPAVNYNNLIATLDSSAKDVVSASQSIAANNSNESPSEKAHTFNYLMANDNVGDVEYEDVEHRSSNDNDMENELHNAPDENGNEQKKEEKSENVSIISENGKLDEVQHAEEDEDEEGTMLKGAVYVAIYDYDTVDDDEVSFVENDKIINIHVIDEGWIRATVERTGKSGMIPFNYVQPLL